MARGDADEAFLPCMFCGPDGMVADPEASAEKFFGWVEMPCPVCGGTQDMGNSPIWGYG